MGLQSQLSDVSSENILVLVTVLVARGARYIRSLVFAIMHGLGLGLMVSSHSHTHHCNFLDATTTTTFVDDVVGSGLSGIIALCEQLNLNRVFSHHGERFDEPEDCVVCLSRMEHGERVRQLPCLHVFHSDCLEGWLHRLNFNCPLCRAPSTAVSDDASFRGERRRVTMDLLTWFDSTAN